MNTPLLAYRHPSISVYKPKPNRKKQGLILTAVVACLATPGTNWLIPLLSKINPLWIYK